MDAAARRIIEARKPVNLAEAGRKGAEARKQARVMAARGAHQDDRAREAGATAAQ